MPTNISTNTLPLASPSAGNGRAFGFAGAMARRCVDLFKAWRSRRDLTLLASFDDRMLADIGLTRSDLRDAAAALPWRDPTSVLVSRVGERRRHRGRSVTDDAIVPTLPAPPIAPALEDISTRQFPARSPYY